MIWEKIKEAQNQGLLCTFNAKEHDSELVIRKNDPKCVDPSYSGGKGSSLAILSIVKDITVPDFFVVTTKAFQNSLINCEEFNITLQELESLNNQDNKIGEIARKLKEIVKNITFSKELIEEITKSYQELCNNMGEENFPVAVRSSATTEDTADASFAGQHSTYLNQIGIENVLLSVKHCWASVFNKRAVEYRNRLKIRHEEALVGVVIQAMINPIAAGTGFSVEIATGFSGLHIAASYGLGEGVVSGDVTSDEWLFQNHSPFRLIKQTLGSKSIQYIRKKHSNGIKKVKVDDEKASTFCLTLKQAKEIAKSILKISNAYRLIYNYEQIDTEFALSKDNNQIYLLQARCVVPSIKQIETVKSSVSSLEIILRGKYALIGAVHGKIKLIKNFEDLVSEKVIIEPDDIIVAVKTGNYWNQFLKHLKGIITVEGSPTAHPMLIGRERNIPCVIGCPNALERLECFDGKWVTLDGLKKAIFIGKQPLVHASHDELKHRFNVVEDIELPSDEQSQKYLLEVGRAIRDENDSNLIWVANPDHTLSPIWANLTQESYSLRTELILAARDVSTHELLTRSMRVLNDTTIIKNSKVYDYLCPLRETMRVFDDFSIEDCEKFIKLRDEQLDLYSKCCDEFFDSPSEKTWKDYENSFKTLTAQKWLSWFFRSYLEQIVISKGKEIACSCLHLDEMQELYQEELGFKGMDLDRELFMKISSIRDKIIPDVSYDNQPDSIKEQIYELATNYRISKNSNIENDPPVEQVWKKCSVSTPSAPVDGHFDEGSSFYVENPDFVKLVKLSIEARIQHCNSHHIFMKGQFKIRTRLLKLGLTDWNISNLELMKLF